MSPLLRLATPNDADQVQAIYAPYCFTPISFELEPPSVDTMRQRLSRILETYPWLVCEADGRILGYVYASLHRERPAYRWSVDTTAYIHPEERRRGLGRALYTALLQMLPLQGYVNAFAGVTLPNPASVGLHEAMGFQPLGVYRQVGFKCGAWHDVAWYQRILQSPPAQPRTPKALHEVHSSPAWAASLEAGQALLGS